MSQERIIFIIWFGAFKETEAESRHFGYVNGRKYNKQLMIIIYVLPTWKATHLKSSTLILKRTYHLFSWSLRSGSRDFCTHSLDRRHTMLTAIFYTWTPSVCNKLLCNHSTCYWVPIMWPAMHSALVHAKDPEALSLGGGSEVRSRCRITTQWDDGMTERCPKCSGGINMSLGFMDGKK